MDQIEPLVSVVIPTRGRPDLVTRAVESALMQTLQAIEVIVVVDGPDAATRDVLAGLTDARLRVKILSEAGGLAGARNAGVAEARGRWVASLDDDDEWLPDKLEAQLQTARQSPHLYPIVSCRVAARTEQWDFVWPRRVPRPLEPVSEYLFCRKSPFWGEGLVQSSTIFTASELLRRVPRRSGHEDIDWLLRACAVEGAGLEFVPRPEPLVIWHIEGDHVRLSRTRDWRHSLSWARANRDLFTARAYASFLLTWASLNAGSRREWSGLWSLLEEACRHGRPGLMDLLSYLSICLTPAGLKNRLAAVFDKMNRAGHVGLGARRGTDQARRLRDGRSVRGGVRQ